MKTLHCIMKESAETRTPVAHRPRFAECRRATATRGLPSGAVLCFLALHATRAAPPTPRGLPSGAVLCFLALHAIVLLAVSGCSSANRLNQPMDSDADADNVGNGTANPEEIDVSGITRMSQGILENRKPRKRSLTLRLWRFCPKP